MLNLLWTWGWSGYKGAFENWGVFGMFLLFPYLSMFSNDFQWRLVSCRTQLIEGRSEQTMILHLCGSGKYATALCFNIRVGDARVPASSRTWIVEGFLEWSLMYWVITRLGYNFHFGTSEIK